MNFEQIDSVKHSLDLTSDRLVEYVPYLFQDFWEMGTDTRYMIDLLRQQDSFTPDTMILDLCCGKGATLIKLVQEFGWQGIGVDIVGDFISQANMEAFGKRVKQQVEFIEQDISLFLKKNVKKFDIIVFSYDTQILGKLDEALETLSHHLSSDGYVIIEADYQSYQFAIGLEESETESAEDLIIKSPLNIVAKQVWDHVQHNQQNQHYMDWLKKRVGELKQQKPELSREFDQFIEHQAAITKQYKDNDISCATWLLKK